MAGLVMLTHKRLPEPMPSPEAIVEAIELRGGRIWAEDGRIRFQMPAGHPVPVAFIKAIKAQESELLALLASK